MNGILIKGLALSALLGLLLIACKSDSGKVQSYDTESPHVISLSPGDASSDVPVNTSLSIGFDEAMYPSTINFNSEDTNCSGSLQLSRDGFFSCVPMSSTSLSISPDKKVFSISPKSSLQGSATYKLKITTKAKDLALNPLKQDFVMSSGFTTRLLAGAQAIYFGDENTKENELRGTIKIERALNESGLTGYNLYWGSSPDTRLAGSSPIRYFYVSETKLEHYLENMAIPGGATHFLVYSATATGESLTPVSLDIPDTVLKMVADICPGGSGSNPKHFTEYAGKLFFSADDCSGSAGEELWAYDGVNSTFLVKDIWAGSGGSFPGKKVVYKGKLVFNASGIGVGDELWQYDDVTKTAIELSDSIINFGVADSKPRFPTIFNDNLYFRARDTTNGNELWKYNGSTISLVSNMDSSSDNSLPDSTTDVIAVYKEKLYFAANSGSGNKLSSYDGATTPVTVAACSSLTIPMPPLGAEFYEYSNKLFFRAEEASYGLEMWYYDGINCSLLNDIFPGAAANSSEPKEFKEFNGKLFFQAQNSTNNRELWVYDGINPPSQVGDINPSASSNPSFLTVYKDMLIFSATTAEHGTELYGYMPNDPSGSPFMIGDINSGAGGSMPEFLTIFNNRLYFTANDGIKGNEIWVFYIE
ncbi:MAG: Ig-like domain-containing protein [bacterium]